MPSRMMKKALQDPKHRQDCLCHTQTQQLTKPSGIGTRACGAFFIILLGSSAGQGVMRPQI